MQSGSIWLTSSSAGQATLLDAPTAQVETSVQVQGAAGRLTMVDSSASSAEAYALLTNNTVAGISGVTDLASRPRSILSGATMLFPTSSQVYLVDPGGPTGHGDVVVAGPTHLDVRQRVSLPGTVRSATLDGAGRLWLLDASGDLFWVDQGGMHERPKVAEPGSLLGTTGGDPVIVEDAVNPFVAVIDPGSGRITGRACLNAVPGDPTLAVGDIPAGPTYVTSSEDGALLVADPASAGCDRQIIRIAPRGDRLGPPVVTDGRAFVADYSSGKVLVVDANTGSHLATTVFNPPPRASSYCSGTESSSSTIPRVSGPG